MNEVIAMLQRAVKEKFWGQIEVTFHNGDITVVRRTETLKVGNGQENTRHYEQRNGRNGQ